VASIVVCGGSVVGLSSAMMLARDGHRVTVLERDPAPPPGPTTDAWEWARAGVAQFHQPHTLLPPFRAILEAELPGTVDRLLDAGCIWLDWLTVMPPLIRDRAPRPDDDRFRFVTGRRPVVEAVLARVAAEEGIEVRRGVAVAGVRTGPGVVDGVPHITGVRTAGGEEIEADLVVDAMGRRTRLAEWLAAAGGPAPHEESEDNGFVYHSRYFRGPEVPAFVGPPVCELGTISLLTIPADNGTWSVTVWAASSDTELRGLRDPERFTAVVRSCPLQAHWLDGEPTSDVLVAAGVLDRYRRFLVDGRPVATGVAAVGDAWACTNPSAGRGMTVGMIHAQALRDVVRSDGGDAEGFVRAWDDATERRVAPFYRSQITADRARLQAMDALRRGQEPAAPDPVAAAVASAMMRDADVFRGALEMGMCMAFPEDVMSRPGFMDKVQAAAGGRNWKLPGPDRATLLDLVAGRPVAG
jgi:2-polyprenyl-6-methoxyphenol hydroxylase-like FAD-dependent oxidoreductase